MEVIITPTDQKGFIHYVDGNKLIRSYKGKIFLSENNGIEYSLIIDLSKSFIDNMMLCNSKIRRLFRFYIYHIIPFHDQLIIFGLKRIFVICLKEYRLLRELPLSGSRPLIVCNDNFGVYYGEYFSNKDRKPVCLFRYTIETGRFDKFYEFKNIRHIHGVFHDPYTGKIFLTTGDDDHESFIGYIDNNEIIKYVSGNQQSRVVVLLFDIKYIYYATDAPFEKNFIYRINRHTGVAEKLQEIGGTVFYGATSSSGIIFSTVVDTNKNLRQDNVELWYSYDGTGWEIVQQFRKDFWPKNLFQHGHLIISNMQFNSSTLWFTPIAVQGDHVIHKLTTL